VVTAMWCWSFILFGYSDTSMLFIFLVIPYLLLISSSDKGRRRYSIILADLEADTMTFCPAECVSYTANKTVLGKNVYKPHVYSAFMNPVR
jgi:hypothetical protein